MVSASVPRMSISMEMGSMMSMGDGVPSLFYMQQIFWAFVGTTIGVVTITNVLNKILAHQRISTRTTTMAAKPQSIFFQSQATISAIIREYSNYSLPLSFGKTRVFLPPMGSTTILIAYVILIVVYSLYKLNPDDVQQWEDIGYRAGFIAIAQVPLIVLLAGKRNIIGLLTGVGYERLNRLHRWVARCLLLTTLIHMGFFLTEWAKYDYIKTKIQSDDITQKGLIAGGILLWLVISSAAPIWNLSYEVFVVQHVASWIAFIAVLFMHVPAENQIWIFLPIAIWGFDRLVRAVYLVYNYASLFHKNSRRKRLLACKATFELLDENHTRITIPNPPITWEAGQHLFLACHVVAPLSSHPFTIASIPSDGKLEFVVRAKKGATKRFFRYAQKAYPGLHTSTSEVNIGRSVLMDGPYSRIRPLRQFDSLVFLAGSTGATFTVPLMRDIVLQWMGTGSTAPSNRFGLLAGAVTRYIRFIWVFKNSSAITWFAAHLSQVLQDVRKLQDEGHDIAVNIEIYITAADKSLVDENFNSEIQLLPGRPDVRNIIYETAETALGEMAVVVCGPAGLVQNVRNAAVGVSVERGVHKGTGAQGIYVHAEAFGYV